MLEAPVFVTPAQRGFVGDDPLGLAATNERLYNVALPGFNNYVRYIRVYSALCWTAVQVEKALEGGAAVSSRDARALFKAAFEKMELAIVWANPKKPQLAGMRRKFPEDNKSVQLAFSTFGASEATLFEAVTYRPSLTTGLGFLEKRKYSIYGCLEAGERLAFAYDSAVKHLSGYRWLKSTDKTNGKRTQIDALHGALDVASPSKEEQDSFLERFFPQRLDDGASSEDRRRWLTLQLALRAVKAVSVANKALGYAAAADAAEVRACMARGAAIDGVSIVEPDLVPSQARWAVLQVRQLQRLCLEALYCAVERWIHDKEVGGGSQAIDDCCAEVAAAGVASLPKGMRAKVVQQLDALAGQQGSFESMYEAAASAAMQLERQTENVADIFLHIDRLEDQSRLDFGSRCHAVADAYTGLLLCAIEVGNLAKHPQTLKALRSDLDLCSLMSLHDLVNRSQRMGVAEFLSHLVKDWVVLRHFTVARDRSLRNDGKNRFRFVMGDHGLERFDKLANLPLPARSEDKLNHALMLCEQAGLLRETRSGYVLTRRGGARLIGALPRNAIR
jgi:hypothetical protein